MVDGPSSTGKLSLSAQALIKDVAGDGEVSTTDEAIIRQGLKGKDPAFVDSVVSAARGFAAVVKNSLPAQVAPGTLYGLRDPQSDPASAAVAAPRNVRPVNLRVEANKLIERHTFVRWGLRVFNAEALAEELLRMADADPVHANEVLKVAFAIGYMSNRDRYKSALALVESMSDDQAGQLDWRALTTLDDAVRAVWDRHEVRDASGKVEVRLQASYPGIDIRPGRIARDAAKRLADLLTERVRPNDEPPISSSAPNTVHLFT